MEQCEAVYLNRFTSEASSWRYWCVLFDCDRKEAIGEEEWLCILNPTGQTSSFATHFNILKFRGKPSLITVICMDLHILSRPTNKLRQNIVFSYSEMIPVSVILYSLFFVFFYYFMLIYVILLLLIFTKIILLWIFYSNFFCSCQLLLFFHVPACSGMLCVPGFIDAPKGGKMEKPVKSHVFV